jgi:hypothetical protein
MGDDGDEAWAASLLIHKNEISPFAKPNRATICCLHRV